MADLKDITIATTGELQAAGFHHETVGKAVLNGTIVRVAYATANAATWDGLLAGWNVPIPDLATVISTIRERLGPIVDRASTPSFGIAA